MVANGRRVAEDDTPRHGNQGVKIPSKRLNFDTMDTLATSGRENSQTNDTLEQEKTDEEITPRTKITTNNDSPIDIMNQSVCPPENETFESMQSRDTYTSRDTNLDTLSEMNDRTRKTTASSYINTPESRVSFDEQHEFSPIERNNGISLDLKLPSPYKPLELPSKDLGKSNFIIELLQYLILRKFYSPLLIQNRFNLTKKVMWELTELLESREILPFIQTNSMKRREVCGWKAYKLLRDECKYRDLQTDAGLEDIYRETWNETITTINFELAKINRKKNKMRYQNTSTDYTDSSFGGVSSCEKEYMRERELKGRQQSSSKVQKRSHRSVSFLESTLSSVNRSSSIMKKMDRVSINDTPSTIRNITNTSLNESSNSATLGANTPVRFL